MILKIDAKFEEKPICCFKIDKNLVNFDPSTQKSPKFVLWLVPFVQSIKYRGVIFHDTEEPCKIWRKTSLRFGKWHEDFCRFSPEHSKISKICTSMSCFWPKHKMSELKTHRRVKFDGTEYWCKIWRKADLCFQKWHEEFGRFSPEHVQKSKNLDFYWVLLSKVENVWTWNLQESYVSWQWKIMHNLNRNKLVSSKLTRGI